MTITGLDFKTQPHIVEALLKKRNLATARLAPILYPSALVREYKAVVRSYQSVLINLVMERIVRRLDVLLPRWQREAGFKLDAIDDELELILEGISISYGAQVTVNTIENNALRSADRVSQFNKKQNDKIFRSLLSVDPFRSEPWLEQHMRGFAAQNTKLIKSLETSTLSDVQRIVYKGWRQGMSHRTVSKELRDKLKVTRYRADLIARDQISKLNGQLTQLRQTDLGVKRYTWRTSLDERVRATHAANESRVFSWEKPPANTGHPGEDINCRCYAEPILEDLI